MECIYCSGSTQVVNSRPQKRLKQVWRRRRCHACHAVFTTIEAVELAQGLLVRCTDSKIAPFNRDMLFLSVSKALGHREDAIEAASALTATIIAKVRDTAQNGAVEATTIAKTTRETLERFDSVAGVQYGAYHKLP